LGLPIAIAGGTPVSADLLLFEGLGDGLRPLGFWQNSGAVQAADLGLGAGGQQG